jgi:hypothetical protein
MPKPSAMPEPTAAALLLELLELFRERGADRLPTEEAVAALGARLGRPITANRLARTLKPHGAVPRQFRLAGRRVWGYLLADLAGGRDAALPVEKRDAGVVTPPAPAAPEPSVRIAAADRLDAEQEWAMRLAMAAVGG